MFLSDKRKVVWLWMLWEIGLTEDDSWPPQEVSLANGS